MSFPFAHFTSKNKKRLQAEQSLITGHSWIASIQGCRWEELQRFREHRIAEQAGYWDVVNNPDLAVNVEQMHQMTQDAQNSAQIIVPLILQQLQERHPSIMNYGFDLVAWVKPEEGLDLSSPHIVAQYDFYVRDNAPESGIGTSGENIGFPDCRMVIPVNQEDAGIRVSLLCIGMATPHAHAMMLADTSSSIIERRTAFVEQTLRAICAEASPHPVHIPVPDDLRFRFFHHVLLNLIAWWCRENGKELPQIVRVSDDRRIDTDRSDGRAIHTLLGSELEITKLH